MLLKHGLGATLLDELSAAIDQFDASVAETSSGTLDHVVARAELEELSDEVMRLVGMLDGINRSGRETGIPGEAWAGIYLPPSARLPGLSERVRAAK